MAEFRCDLCGKSVKKSDSIEYSLNENKVNVCTDCSFQIEGLKNKETRANASRYLLGQTSIGFASPAGKAFIDDALNQYPSLVSTLAESQPDNQTPKAENVRSEYHDPDSAKVLNSIATILLIIGIIGLIIGLVTLPYVAVAGAICIISSVFLFIIVNISCDIHHMDYTASESLRLQKEILHLLQERKKDA